MEKWKRIVIALIALLPVGASAEESRYGYPIDDCFASSILGTPRQLRPNLTGEVPIRTMVLESDEKKPEIFFYDRGLRYTAAFQERKAPLVFLIAGTGG